MKVLLNIAKYISAIAVIGGAALWFDAQFDKNAESLKDIQQTVDYINTEQSFMAEDLQGIHDTLEKTWRICRRRRAKGLSLLCGG
jgi:hypothetical protein